MDYPTNSRVNVILDNYEDVCFPGQTLSGRVDCIFVKEKTLRSIRITFKGRAKTRWSVKRGKHSTTYRAEEVYFDETFVLNGGTGEDSFTLPAGNYSYPFSYILPLSLPSSFEADYGDIKYTIKATADRPWKFDHEKVVSINVASLLDLNYLPELQRPFHDSGTLDAGCWGMCVMGPITFKISLPITGYVPGQQLNIGAYVENMSNKNIERVYFKIVQKIQFIAHEPSERTREQEITITRWEESGIGAHGEKSWTSRSTIPRLLFPNLLPCSIININYTLEAILVLPCLYNNIAILCPLTFGTVPIAGVNLELPGPPPATAPPLSGPVGDFLDADFDGETVPAYDSVHNTSHSIARPLLNR